MGSSSTSAKRIANDLAVIIRTRTIGICNREHQSGDDVQQQHFVFLRRGLLANVTINSDKVCHV